MSLKKFWVALLAVLLMLSSIPLTIAKAAGVQENDEVAVNASAEKPLVLLANPNKSSENAVVITEDSSLTILEVGGKYKKVTYTDDVSREQISGYVLVEELKTYLSDVSATKVVVAPSEQEPLELFVDGKLEGAVYLTEETTLISLEEEGHYTTVKYTIPSTGETVEALVLSDALRAAVIEDNSAEESIGYVEIPEGESLSFLDEPSTEGSLVFDLLVDSYLTIGEELQYLKVAYQDTITGNIVEGYILYSELANFTDDIKGQKDEGISDFTRSSNGIIPKPVILDISHWQVPTAIDYDKLAAEVGLVIIRVQDGGESGTKDRHYQTHIQEFQKRGIPVHVYAFMRASTVEEARKEAQLFYERAKQYDPIMYWVDVEVVTSSDMRSIVSAYVSQLRTSVGDAKVGAYIAHHLYTTFNVNIDELDGTWIPRYDLNNGLYSGVNPDYATDIHQYTDRGKLNGYASYLDLNRLTDTNGKDLTYFTSKNSDNNNVSDTFYSTNPEMVRMLVTDVIYSSVEFNNSTNTNKTLPVGSIVSVSGIEYSKAGVPRLKIDGGYISANKKYSSTDTTTFYSSNPGKVRMLVTDVIYSSVEFNNSTNTNKTLPVGSTVTVSGIAYSKAGIPRLKVDGGYITANKKYSSTDTTTFYSTSPEKVRMLVTDVVYSSVEFNNSTKTNKTLPVGSIVTVSGIAYSKAGIPRLKVDGGYITANKKYSSTDITTFYSANPGKVRMLVTDVVYSSVEFNNSTKTNKTLPVGSIVTVSGISYSKAGIPRLKVDGGYITANKKYSSTDITTFYSSNPGKVRMLVTDVVYSSVEFNNSTKTNKTLPVGSIVTVHGIAYSKAGVPRLKVDGGYITANKKYSSTDTTTFYSANPGKVRMLATDVVYSSVEFNNSTKTNKTVRVGSVVTIKGMAYSRTGVPRLMVDGGYITANKKYSEAY